MFRNVFERENVYDQCTVEDTVCGQVIKIVTYRYMKLDVIYA